MTFRYSQAQSVLNALYAIAYEWAEEPGPYKDLDLAENLDDDEYTDVLIFDSVLKAVEENGTQMPSEIEQIFDGLKTHLTAECNEGRGKRYDCSIFNIFYDLDAF